MTATNNPADASTMDIEKAKRLQAEDLATEEERGAACHKEETEASNRKLYKGLAFGGGLLLLAAIALVIFLKLQKKKK